MEISPAQAVEMMKAQQQEIAKRDARIAELENIIQKLLSQSKSVPPTPNVSETNPINKGEPMFKISDLQKKWWKLIQNLNLYWLAK